MDEIFVEEKTIIDVAEWHNDSFYIVFHGMLEIKNAKGEMIDQFGEGDFLGEQINIDLLEENITFGVEKDTVLLKFDKNSLSYILP